MESEWVALTRDQFMKLNQEYFDTLPSPRSYITQGDMRDECLGRVGLKWVSASSTLRKGFYRLKIINKHKWLFAKLKYNFLNK